MRKGQKHSGYKRRQNTRKWKKIKHYIALSAEILLCLCLLTLVIFLVIRGISKAIDHFSSGPDTPVPTQEVQGGTEDISLSGVTVDGIPFEGKTPEELTEILESRYDTGKKKSITLTFGERTWTLNPDDIEADYHIEEQVQAAWDYIGDYRISGFPVPPADFEIELDYDAKALQDYVQRIKDEVDCSPVDATMNIVEIEQFRFTDSSDGYSLDTQALSDQIIDMIVRGESGAIELTPEVIPPQVSREELELSTVLLGECYTSLEGSSSSRTSNVNLALSYFNFMVIEPDQKVSFNRTVGKRTTQNGFKEAPEYAGTTVVSGIGGGTCQASTTVYGAIIRAGLEILERHPHTMTVGYVPSSQDAAVNENDKDMRFKNTTGSRLYVFAYVDNEKNQAVCKVYGRLTDPHVSISIESVVTQTDISGNGVTYKDDVDGKYVWFTDEAPVLYKQGKPGITSAAYRVFTNILTGEEISRERLSKDTYRPEDDVYWRGVHTR